MDRIIFGDNQFFGVNHLSFQKEREQSIRFRNVQSIIKILDIAIELGINTFMCTTYNQISEICDNIRANEDKYKDFKIYPCMPYAHKYASALTEKSRQVRLMKTARDLAMRDIAYSHICQ